MLNLYERNGTPFWTGEQVELRRLFEVRFVRVVTQTLREQNRAFEFHQVEAPILTPLARVNEQYHGTGMTFELESETALRPETTMGSYAYAEYLIDNAHRLPMVIWQHGKSFRNEQDQVTKNLRLKEFYQLEFQTLYSDTTKNDYGAYLRTALLAESCRLLGPCHMTPSDRLPSYAERTDDIVLSRNELELCSISIRKDCPIQGTLNAEVAIGTDRCLVSYLNSDDKAGESTSASSGQS